MTKKIFMQEDNKRSTSLKEDIASGLYYKEMINFYNYSYINPFVERSFLYIISCTLLILVFAMLYRMYDILPLKKEVRYVTIIKNNDRKRTNIIKADYYSNDPESSIAKILSEKYVQIREEYDYNKIEGQLRYVLGSSSKLEFRKYYNYISIDNPESPVLKYKKEIKRRISIANISLDAENNKFTIIFESRAVNKNDEIVENNIYQATLNYIMKNMRTGNDSTKNFFSVIDYKIKLIKQNA